MTGENEAGDKPKRQTLEETTGTNYMALINF